MSKATPRSPAPERNADGGTHISKDEGAARLGKAKEQLPHGEGGIHNPKPGQIDYASMATSTRPLHRQAAGKGSDRRAPTVDDAKVTANWCATFGHKWVGWLDRCANGCGAAKAKKA